MNFTLQSNKNYFRKRTRTKITTGDINGNIYLTVGMLLLLLYTLQLVLNVKFEALYELQTNNVYKQITGYMLLLYILHQFKLAKVRKDTKLIRHHFNLHKIQGVFAPLVLYIHSMELGYAYQAFLTCLFLSNCFIGLINPQQFKIRNIYYVNSWLILHVIIALSVVGLVLYHLFITYWYS